MVYRVELNHLLRETQEGRFTRREILQRALGIGLSAPAIATLLAACGGDDDADEPSPDNGEAGAGDDEPTQADDAGEEPTRGLLEAKHRNRNRVVNLGERLSTEFGKTLTSLTQE